MRADGIKWKITVVYGPHGDAAKLQFLQELKNIPPPPDHNRWLILGDFNPIYQEEDKNNSNLNHRLMDAFRATINHLHLKEIKLNGRRFTWSNQQDMPTLTRIDRFLCTPEWKLIFPACFLHHCHHSCQTTHHCCCKESSTIITTRPFSSKISGLRWMASRNVYRIFGIGRSPLLFL